MVDDFFDDEQELMGIEPPAQAPADGVPAEGADAVEAEGAAPAASHEAAAPAPAPAGEATSGRTPPPFWMVLAIAIIALLLGVIIGYLLGSSSALAALEQQQEQLQSQQDSGAYELPEGHPQVEVDEDGSAHVVDGGSTSTDAE